MSAVDEAREALHAAWSPDALDAAIDALIAAVRAETLDVDAAERRVWSVVYHSMKSEAIPEERAMAHADLARIEVTKVAALEQKPRARA